MSRGEVFKSEEGVPVASSASTWIVLHNLIMKQNTHHALV